MGRFPRASHLSLIGIAGVAAMLLLPGDETRRPETSLTLGTDPVVTGSTGTEPGAAEAQTHVALAPLPATGFTATTNSEPAPEAIPVVASAEPRQSMPAPLPAMEEQALPARTLWVGASAVNVRAGPSPSTAKLFVLRQGQKVSASETSGGWTLIVDDDSGESGWVASRYLSDSALPPDARQQPATAEQSRRVGGLKFARVTDSVTLRAGPSRFSPRLFMLRPGEKIAVLETRGRWLHVVLENGVSAWVDLRDL